MADPCFALRHVADEHPALSAIGAGTFRHDDGRRGNAGAKQIDPPAELDNGRARSVALLDGASDSGINLQRSLGILEMRAKVTFRPKALARVKVPGKQPSVRMLAARKRLASILST